MTNPSSKLVVFGSTDPLVTSDVVDAFGFNNNVGVHGRTGTAFGILGSVSDSGYAGYFMGRVNVTGTLSKGAGSFKIDHPLDPHEDRREGLPNPLIPATGQRLSQWRAVLRPREAGKQRRRGVVQMVGL